MTNQHPITPSPELVQQLYEMPRTRAIKEAFRAGADHQLKLDAEQIAQAYQAGADQELEACCEWLHWQNLATHPELIPSLRAARRPKPPGLKEQALEALNEALEHNTLDVQYDTIRQALEQLDD